MKARMTRAADHVIWATVYLAGCCFGETYGLTRSPVSGNCRPACRNMRVVGFARVAVFVLWVLVTYGEEVRSVRGIVTDETGHALEGAVVQIQDRTTMGVRSYLTQRDGCYHFEDLSSDLTYHLRARYSGVFSHPKLLSKFDSHRVAVIDLTVHLSK